MTLHPTPVTPVSEETTRIARAAVPKGNVYIQMRDVLGAIYTDQQFADLFATRGRPVVAPWRLALVIIMQFAEGLSDRQAAEAVRVRIDWKYALGRDLANPGCDYSVLTEFRTRLVHGAAEQRLLDALLEACKARGLLKSRGCQRTDSTHVLGALRVLSRLERAAAALRATLNAVATAAPDWLQERVPLEWYDRYGRRIEDYRSCPKACQPSTPSPAPLVTISGMAPTDPDGYPYIYLGQDLTVFGTGFSSTAADNEIIICSLNDGALKPLLTSTPTRSQPDRLDVVAPTSTMLSPGSYKIRVSVRNAGVSDDVGAYFASPTGDVTVGAPGDETWHSPAATTTRGTCAVLSGVPVRGYVNNWRTFWIGLEPMSCHTASSRGQVSIWSRLKRSSPSIHCWRPVRTQTLGTIPDSYLP